MTVIKRPSAMAGIFAAAGLLAGLLSGGLAWSEAPVPVAPAAGPAGEPSPLERLGEALFFDPDLSQNRTQACATCHDPAHGFADPRRDAHDGAVSRGDDGHSVGTRNAPTVAYAAFSPAFHRDAEGRYVGGQFLDGRAETLEAQAGQPMLNPVEMGMPDKASVVARLKEKPFYREAFSAQFGTGVLDDEERAFAALSSAIAAYERSPAVSPFDSKYDRYLRGEYKMTDQEELGRVLFFSNQFTNCHLCHLSSAPGAERETFSTYMFHNIGVPPNPALGVMAADGKTGEQKTTPPAVDHGLQARPGVAGAAYDGQFRVPTLRNTAVTGPYMHNGVFQNLRTAVKFYNKYNSRSPARQIDPETGDPWAPPEVKETVALKELEFGPALDDRRINALVAFLKTLTDQRYEHLLERPPAGK